MPFTVGIDRNFTILAAYHSELDIFDCFEKNLRQHENLYFFHHFMGEPIPI